MIKITKKMIKDKKKRKSFKGGLRPITNVDTMTLGDDENWKNTIADPRISSRGKVFKIRVTPDFYFINFA